MSYLDEMFGLDGKTVVITGGGGVIAGAMSEALLKAGAKVVLWDIEKKFADAAVERLTEKTGAGDRLFGVQVDAMSEDSVREAVQTTESVAGRVEILINAAGGNRGKGPDTEHCFLLHT